MTKTLFIFKQRNMLIQYIDKIRIRKLTILSGKNKKKIFETVIQRQ